MNGIGDTGTTFGTFQNDLHLENSAPKSAVVKGINNTLHVMEHICLII
jgi:hypothetical protein